MALFVATGSVYLFAQAPSALPSPINTPLGDEVFPSVSADGKSLLLLSNYGEDKPYPVISYLKGGVWTRPEEISSFTEGNFKLNNNTGFNFSPDGNTIFFSSNKYGGLGNNDIWYMEKNNSGKWSAPANPGKPLNTAGNEADPSLSPDGKTLFFVRYTDKKTPSGLPCGKIYTAQRIKNNSYKEAIELPASINAGCECAPKILSDGKTLFFASVRNGGKGGYDQYVSKMKNDGTWSTPVPLALVNTPEDDIYISVPAAGDLVYFTKTITKSKDIVRARIPNELQPDPVVLIQGIVNDENKKSIASSILVTNTSAKKLSAVHSLYADENIFLILPKGNNYDVSFYGSEKGYYYQSHRYELDTLSKFKNETLNITLKSLHSSRTFKIADASQNIQDINFELDKLSRVLQENSNLTIEISILLPKPAEELKDSTEITGIPTISEPIEKKICEDVVAYLKKKGLNNINIINTGIVYPEHVTEESFSYLQLKVNK